MLQCKKFTLKIHTKVKIVKFVLFLKFFSSLFSYAHAFSEVILDCRAKIVFTKLLDMLISNFYGQTLSL
jgi:hypothetical protein